MSYHIGHHRRSRSKPYYGIIRQARRRGEGEGRWYWTIRRYEDNSTAARGAGQGFESEDAARADMDHFLQTVWSMTIAVYDQ